ncbi:MAG: hypothetical protein MZW92_70240 [Comamonadaceae bacterium]|nr:hypothetical protein [Comamonadaceae bacterium]
MSYSGSFNQTEGLYATGTPQATFAGVTPFTIRAAFDDASPNQAPPFFNGFRAYVPTTATIEILGETYSIETAAQNAARGVTVAIFDRSQVFFPGYYGVGLIADVVADGAGIVGDFTGASPDFTVDALTPTTFTGYRGVGHGSGPCVTGMPPSCSHYIVPWVLRDENAHLFRPADQQLQRGDGRWQLHRQHRDDIRRA